MTEWNRITVLGIDDVYLVRSVKGKNHRIINRKTYGLSFCQGGQITYFHNGASYVSDRRCAILLPQGQSYFLRRDETGIFPVINFVCTEAFSPSEFLTVPLRNPDSYLKIADRMRALWVTEQDPALLMSLFYELLSRLSVEERKDSPRQLLSPAMDYLGNHFSDPTLSNEILARQAGISEVYFRKLFRRAYGTTPRQYILETRIRHAKTLLAEHASTVTAISEACGFSGVYHFCRAFKEITGQTPTEYEKNTLNG